MSSVHSVVIHGHFYQPPREDPWLGEVESEPSAAPFHDWNQRIDRECYRAVTAARIQGPDGRIARIVNTLTGISYDAGPTLLSWMERESPATYSAFLEADHESRRRLGFGNAIAMPYHHVILPLCSRRDKVTEVRWGVRDFRGRFDREPEGMWLPEAAVDHETLEVLADEGIRFTVVGPGQVRKVPDGHLPARHRGSRGRSIAVFVYDGPLAHDVAFGPLVRDADRWVERMLPAGGKGRHLVSLATDGETWGHHHKFGELALATVLDRLGQRPDVRVENFASFLSRNPPLEDVSLVSPSSWSCPHGVERWRSDCGCRTAPHLSTPQHWRAPLRTALDWLADQLHALYLTEGKPFLADAWEARDEHGPVAVESPRASPMPVRIREILEMERNTLAMFTSCGWFFDDVADVATVVVLRHAARAIDLAGERGRELETGLLERLALAKSSDPEVGNAAQLYRARIKDKPPAPIRAGAGFAAARTAAPGADAQLPGYSLIEQGQGVLVEDRRTGRQYPVDAVARRLSVARLGVDVEARPIPLGVLPERHQSIVRHALSLATAEQRLLPTERETLSAGVRDFDGVLEDALTEAAGALGGDRSDAALARLADLLDLFDLRRMTTIPYDAQTRFYRAWSCASGDQLARLTAMAPRLGFVST